MLSNEPRTVDEGYASACASSDLRVEAEKRGDADLIIAAGLGWNDNRIGGALMRLISEWHGVAKPVKPTRKQITGMAEQLFRSAKARSLKDCSAEATESAWAWYSDELERVASRLKSLPAVHRQVATKLSQWGVQNAESKAMRSIGWWLIQRCDVCGGTQWEVAKGTNRQTAQACPGCRGTGEMRLPDESLTLRVAVYLDVCIGKYRRTLIDYKETVGDIKAFVSPRKA